jgi:hypothetical protein
MPDVYHALPPDLRTATAQARDGLGMVAATSV